MNLKRICKPGTVIAFLAFSFAAFAQADSEAVKEIESHRKKQEQEMLDKAKSPLLPEDREKFQGLNYYPIDLKYRVPAKFVRTENMLFFKMKTTTARLPDYVKYGEVLFNIDGREFKLEVYQSPDVTKLEGYADYLFIPFTDLTNGYETYDVGRYLEFRIPQSEDVIIDFNKCYNPYCSYNPKYSCPIPPEPNQLPIAIPAGEKKFKEH